MTMRRKFRNQTLEEVHNGVQAFLIEIPVVDLFEYILFQSKTPKIIELSGKLIMIETKSVLLGQIKVNFTHRTKNRVNTYFSIQQILPST